MSSFSCKPDFDVVKKEGLGSGAFAIVLLVNEMLLEEDAVVASVPLFERRRAKRDWKEAIEDKRRKAVRRVSGWATCKGPVSLESLFRDGISFVRIVR